MICVKGLGKYYKRSTEPTSSMWAESMQSFVRRQHLYRTSWVISDTPCIVDVYGLGVSGRVVATGPSKRVLIIEALSLWNSQKYSIVLKINMLMSLLPGRSHLFKAGNKYQLVRALVDLLYFEYTVQLPPLLLEGKVFNACKNLHVIHTEKLNLPAEYPQRICDIIRIIGDPKSWRPIGLVSGHSLTPILAQELKINSERKESGMSIRRRENMLIEKAKREEDERTRQQWLKTPIRTRGLRHSICLRRGPKYFILALYITPHRLETATVKAFVPDECGKPTMTIALQCKYLSSLQFLFD